MRSRSLVLCGLLTVFGVFAQPPEDHSHFEVASIRRVDHSVPLRYTGPWTGDRGRIVWSRISLGELILNGYPEYWEHGRHISGPQWIEDEYSVTATIPPGSTDKEVTQMIQNLVKERFGLKFHEESKEVQGFDLVVGEGGFKLTPSTSDAGPARSSNSGMPTRQELKLDQQGFPVLGARDAWRSRVDRESGVERVSFRQCTIGALAGMLAMTYSRSTVPIIDRTEIQGRFDFHLTLPASSLIVSSAGPDMPPSVIADDPIGDLHDVSKPLEKQTGLRLKAVKVTIRTMVIDHVDRTPTAN